VHRRCKSIVSGRKEEQEASKEGKGQGHRRFRATGVAPSRVRSNGGGRGRTNASPRPRVRGPVGFAREGDVCKGAVSGADSVRWSDKGGGGAALRDPPLDDMRDTLEPEPELERLGGGGGARCFCRERSERGRGLSGAAPIGRGQSRIGGGLPLGCDEEYVLSVRLTYFEGAFALPSVV